MRVCADGYISLEDPRRVKTPGAFEDRVDPAPERTAVDFLLSHSFPGCRRVVRKLSVHHRKQIQLAMWATSVSERMSLLDPVWREITEPLEQNHNGGEPLLVQVVRYGKERAYPVYVHRGSTRVSPAGGLPPAKLNGEGEAERIELRTS